MKNWLKIVSIIGLTIMAQTAYAAEITDTYNTGDTLTATTLDTIKNAVNDNNARINTNATTPGPAGPQGLTGAAGTNGTNAASPVANALAPTPADASYPIGSIWVDTTTGATYTLTDNTFANAVWKLITYAPTVYAIGDTGPAGGWVFYVDAEGRHGLEATLAVDEHAGIRWYNGTNTDTEAHGDGIGAGEMNTLLIIANQATDSATYAAGFAANLVITNAGVDYGDWYLPSKYELKLMYDNIGQGGTNVGGFAVDFYWSSSEGSSSLAWDQSFGFGAQNGSNKDESLRVRAVRAF